MKEKRVFDKEFQVIRRFRDDQDLYGQSNFKRETSSEFHCINDFFSLPLMQPIFSFPVEAKKRIKFASCFDLMVKPFS